MLQPDGGLRKASSKEHQKNKREAKGAEAKVVHHRYSLHARDLHRQVCVKEKRPRGGNCVKQLKSNSSNHFSKPKALLFTSTSLSAVDDPTLVFSHSCYY